MFWVLNFLSCRKGPLKLARVRRAYFAPDARQLFSLPGYGHICSVELGGEIGTLERFRNEASLALGRHLCRVKDMYKSIVDHLAAMAGR